MPSPKNTKTRSSVVGKFTSLFFGSAKPKDVKPSQLPALPDEPAAEDAGAAADAYSAFMPMQLSKHVVGEHFKGAGLARTLQPGEVLIAKGEPSDSLFFVISGTLNVMAGGGDEEKEAELAMGEIIGYSSFLLGMLPTRSVLAADGAPTCVLELTFDTAIKLIRTDSQVATDVFRELAVAVTERIEKRSSVLRSSVLQLATATDHGQEDVTVQKAPKGARAAARLAERFFDYGVDVDEVLLLTCPCALLSVEANSKERATRQKAKGGAEDEADDDGELFLFEEHLCVELELFNMTLVTCVELESILSLIKLGGGVVEVECSDRSFTLALDPSRFDEVTTKIEACRIACIPLNQPLGDGDRSSYINNVSGALDGDRGGERVSLDDLAEMSSTVVDMPAEMDLTEPSTMSKKVRNISVDLRSSMKERSKAHGLSMYDAASQQAVDLPAELQAEFQTEEAYPVGVGGRASSAASAAATQAKKLKQLGQSLTMAEWQQFVGGVERRTLKQGEPIIEEGDSPRALYYILRGTIRLEMTIHETTGTDEAQGQRANKRSSKAVRSSRAGRRSHDEMGKKRAVVYARRCSPAPPPHDLPPRAECPPSSPLPPLPDCAPSATLLCHGGVPPVARLQRPLPRGRYVRLQDAPPRAAVPDAARLLLAQCTYPRPPRGDAQHLRPLAPAARAQAILLRGGGADEEHRAARRRAPRRGPRARCRVQGTHRHADHRHQPCVRDPGDAAMRRGACHHAHAMPLAMPIREPLCCARAAHHLALCSMAFSDDLPCTCAYTHMPVQLRVHPPPLCRDDDAGAEDACRGAAQLPHPPSGVCTFDPGVGPAPRACHRAV